MKIIWHSDTWLIARLQSSCSIVTLCDTPVRQLPCTETAIMVSRSQGLNSWWHYGALSSASSGPASETGSQGPKIENTSSSMVCPSVAFASVHSSSLAMIGPESWGHISSGAGLNQIIWKQHYYNQKSDIALKVAQINNKRRPFCLNSWIPVQQRLLLCVPPPDKDLLVK